MVETRSVPRVLIEPSELAESTGTGNILIVDLRKREHYLEGHLPGAVHLESKALVSGFQPAPGKLPAVEQLGAALSAIGLEKSHHVVGYDDEGGGWAARLLWTLDVTGHPGARVLNGGIGAWKQSGYPLSVEVPAIAASVYTAGSPAGPLISRDEILSRLGEPSMALLDARTAEEYTGTRVRASKAGHIPGAVNLNWMDTMDEDRQRRLLPDDTLREMLAARNIGPQQQVVVYCHTHHRSAHSYMMLRHLGYPDVRGYDGSWSEWGNDPDTPAET